jgi:hypothetical protein
MITYSLHSLNQERAQAFPPSYGRVLLNLEILPILWEELQKDICDTPADVSSFCII